jgi:hypothetical protein
MKQQAAWSLGWCYCDCGCFGHAGCLCAHFCEKVEQDVENLEKMVGPAGGRKEQPNLAHKDLLSDEGFLVYNMHLFSNCALPKRISPHH